MATHLPAPEQPKAGGRARRVLQIFYAIPLLFVLGVVGDLVYIRVTHKAPPTRQISARPFASVAINDLKANLFTQGDSLRASGNDIFIEFRDSAQHLVDVGDVTLMLTLQMPDMVMHSIGRVSRTSTPGQYRTTLDPQMAGLWNAHLSFTGSNGKGEASLPVNVQ
jgi:hypothetical protein